MKLKCPKQPFSEMAGIASSIELADI